MEELNHESVLYQKAIELLKEQNVTVSEKGILHITSTLSESWTTIHLWDRIDSIHTNNGNFINLYRGNKICFTIGLEEKAQTPIVYRFLTDKFITHKFGGIPK
jgi:hypothetical protein